VEHHVVDERVVAGGWSRAHRKRLRIGVATVGALLATTPALASETQSYSYDELGRVVKVVHSGSVNNWLSSCYAYDKADNRSNITVLTNGDCAAPLPSFSINSASATEGSAVVFTVTKTGTSYGPLTVNYASTGGTATSGTDFTATSGALSFLASDVTKTISVATTDDTAAENPETFTMTLSNASAGSTIGTATGTGTINDNDAPPNHPPVTVADGGTTEVCVDEELPVLTNDSDPDGDYPLKVTSVTGPYFFLFSSTTVGIYALHTGTFTGTYTAQDSRGATAIGTITMRVVTGGNCMLGVTGT
jgi:hypothetical protein